MQGLLAEVPPHYQQCYKASGVCALLFMPDALLWRWAAGIPLYSSPCLCPPALRSAALHVCIGARVLALAYKQLETPLTPSICVRLPALDAAALRIGGRPCAGPGLQAAGQPDDPQRAAPPAPRRSGEPAHLCGCASVVGRAHGASSLCWVFAAWGWQGGQARPRDRGQLTCFGWACNLAYTPLPQALPSSGRR